MHHALCSFLVSRRKVCFGGLFESLLCAAGDIVLYPLSLKAMLYDIVVVIDFPFMVASWFRQKFDQIESVLELFF